MFDIRCFGTRLIPLIYFFASLHRKTFISALSKALHKFNIATAMIFLFCNKLDNYPLVWQGDIELIYPM